MKRLLLQQSTIIIFIIALFAFKVYDAAHEFQQKPMVVIVPTYNNKDWYEKNLSSILMQEYTNYRVICIDDNSPDGTGQLIHDYIDRHNAWGRVTLIRNKERVGAMANWYNAIHSCKDNEIVVNVDGDDWLPHRLVLKRLNREYADPQVWLTYGQMCMYPSASGTQYSHQIAYDPSNSRHFRHACAYASHLRTYYAWLFKQIKKEDFMYEGQFMPMSCDRAMMAPMLEMAAERGRCINDVLYVYNVRNPLNDYNVDGGLQGRIAAFIEKKEPYARLKELYVS